MPVAYTVGQYGIIVIDEEDQILWQHPIPDIRVYGLEVHPVTGNFFITTHSEIREITRAHHEVWRYSSPDTHGLHTIQVTPSGTLLVAGALSDVVLEVNKRIGVVWTWRAADHYVTPLHYVPGDTRWLHLNHCHRLRNGNTIIGMYYEPRVKLPSEYPADDPTNGRTIEVDPRGELLWSWGTCITRGQHYVVPYGEELLIADSSNERIIRLNKEKRKIMALIDTKAHKEPLSIDVKPNGNFIVSFPRTKQIVEYNKEGEEVWEYTAPPQIEMEANRKVHVAKYLPSWSLEFTPEEQAYFENRLKKLGYIE
jgi:hypothetical protein